MRVRPVKPRNYRLNKEPDLWSVGRKSRKQAKHDTSYGDDVRPRKFVQQRSRRPITLHKGPVSI